MTSHPQHEPPDQSPAQVPSRPSRFGRCVRATGLILLVVGLCGAGLALGRFSKWAQPPAPEAAWEYSLPELSGEISPSYRATIDEAGLGVRAAMEAHPQSPSAVSALALLHYLSHDRTGEERCWERCLALDPKNALANTRLVSLAQQNANYARIVELMNQALEREADNGVYRGMLGSALMYLNRPAEARQQLEANLASGDADAETFLLLGEVYNQLDRPERAKRFLSLAADLAPQRADALYGLVKVCNKLGETEAASKYLAQFQELKAQQLAGEATREELRDDKFMPPRIAEIMNYVGKSYLEAQELAAAEQHFRRAAEISERDPESRKMLSQLMSESQQWDEAIRCVRELRKIEPENSLHYWNEGLLYQRAQRFADAQRVFTDFCQSQPARDLGYASLAMLYLQNNRQLNEARSLAERAVELAPTARNFWLLGSIADKQGDTSTARAALQRAAEIDPQITRLPATHETTPKN